MRKVELEEVNVVSALAYLASDWRIGVSGGMVILIIWREFMEERSAVHGKET